MEPNEKFIPGTEEDVPTQLIEVNIESTEIIEENKVFFALMTLNCHLKNSYGNANKKNDCTDETSSHYRVKLSKE